MLCIEFGDDVVSWDLWDPYCFVIIFYLKGFASYFLPCSIDLILYKHMCSENKMSRPFV